MVRNHLGRVVSLSKTLYSPKVLVIPRRRWLHPDMTEKLLTGTLNLNTNKQTNCALQLGIILVHLQDALFSSTVCCLSLVCIILVVLIGLCTLVYIIQVFSIGYILFVSGMYYSGYFSRLYVVCLKLCIIQVVLIGYILFVSSMYYSGCFNRLYFVCLWCVLIRLF